MPDIITCWCFSNLTEPISGDKYPRFSRLVKFIVCLDSPPVLFHIAVGAGLPSTLHKIEMVTFSFTEKSAFGTVSVIVTGAGGSNKNFSGI